MVKYYSPTDKGFFDSGIHSDMPQDAVAITEDQYQDAFAHVSAGGILQVADGNLILAQLPEKPGDNYIWDEPAGNWVEVPITAEQIKAEAHRRIVAIIPGWQQRNLTAQAAQLAEKGRANWTAEELAAWDAGQAIWDQVKAIREASNLIEAMEPIPTDYADNGYWP
jgi:hypothetical protein